VYDGQTQVIVLGEPYLEESVAQQDRTGPQRLQDKVVGLQDLNARVLGVVLGHQLVAPHGRGDHVLMFVWIGEREPHVGGSDQPHDIVLARMSRKQQLPHGLRVEPDERYWTLHRIPPPTELDAVGHYTIWIYKIK